MVVGYIYRTVFAGLRQYLCADLTWSFLTAEANEFTESFAAEEFPNYGFEPK